MILVELSVVALSVAAFVAFDIYTRSCERL